jgi:hypothetical protein
MKTRPLEVRQDNNLELEESHHIFAPVGKVKKKPKAKIVEEVCIVRTSLGKKLENFLKEKKRHSLIYNNYYEENFYTLDMSSKFEIPLLNKRQLDRKSFKLKVCYRDSTFNELEDCMLKLRGERIKTKPVQAVAENKQCDDSDDDIFVVKIVDVKPITTILQDDDDFFKYRDMDIATILKPFQKNK